MINTELFTVTYRPTCLQEFVGNAGVASSLSQWIASPPAHKGALVHGLCGIGKTILVDLVLQAYGCRKATFGAQVAPTTMFGEKNVVVVDGDDVSAKDMVDFLRRSTQVPLICIVDNVYDAVWKPLVTHCDVFKLAPPTYAEVYPLLYRVVTSEKIRIKEPELRQLCDQANGDIRFMLNALHAYKAKPKAKFKETDAPLHREKDIQSRNVFETSAFLLSMDESLDAKFEMYEHHADLHPLMIQENYVGNLLSSRDPLKGLDTMASAAQVLSDMDVFQGAMIVCGGGGWDLVPYVGVHALAAATRCNKKGLLAFPRHLSRKTESCSKFKDLKEPQTKKTTQPKALKEPKVSKEDRKSTRLNSSH